MATCSDGMQIANNFALQLCIRTNPDAFLVPQKTTMQCKLGHYIWINRQFLQNGQSARIKGVALYDLLQPCWLNWRNCIKSISSGMRASRKSISSPVICTLPVNYFIIQAKKFSERLLLPSCMQTLVWQVNQSSLISQDYKLLELQVRAPLFHS